MNGTSTLLTDGSGAADFWVRAVAGSRWWRIAIGTRLRPARRSHRAALHTLPPASRATIIRKAERFRSRSSAPKVPSKAKCPCRPASADPRITFIVSCAVARLAGTQLVRSPSHSRRAEAARRSARHGLLLTTIAGAVIIALMYALDAREIVLMPPRGTVSLWPVRILTDFGEIGLCAVVPGRAVVRRGNYFPPIAGNLTSPAARLRHAPAVCVFCRAGAGSHRRGHQMGRRARPAVCRRRGPTLSTSRTSTAPRRTPASHRAMPSRASHWLSLSRRSGRRQGWS